MSTNVWSQQSFLILSLVFSAGQVHVACEGNSSVCYDFPGKDQHLFCRCENDQYYDGHHCQNKEQNPCRSEGEETPSQSCIPECSLHGLTYACSCPSDWQLDEGLCGELLFHVKQVEILGIFSTMINHTALLTPKALMTPTAWLLTTSS